MLLSLCADGTRCSARVLDGADSSVFKVTYPPCDLDQGGTSPTCRPWSSRNEVVTMIELNDFSVAEDERPSVEFGLIEGVVAAFSDYESIGAEVAAGLWL